MRDSEYPGNSGSPHFTSPPETNAGLDFSYASWNADSFVKFCNVRWGSDYRDVIKKDTDQAFEVYIQGLPGIMIDGLTYARYGAPIRVDKSFAQLQNYNYIQVTNKAQPWRNDIQTTFYYFITDIAYIAPDTTQINIQLDVWSTYINRVQFGNCYIESGHIGIANSKNFDNYGRDYLTQPDGLDIGGEYTIVDQYRRNVGTARAEGEVANTESHRVLVVSTVDLERSGGTVDAPVLVTATGSGMENLPNGAAIYLFQSSVELSQWLQDNQEKPWVTQGIISITAIPAVYTIPVHSDTSPVVVKGGTLKTVTHTVGNKWRTKLGASLGRYKNLKKFLTYPYTIVEMTTYAGSPLIIKPESWNQEDLVVVEMPHFAPPAPRLMFYPKGYNAQLSPNNTAQTDTNGLLNDGGEFLDFAIGLTNFPMFSVVNNGYMGYLASNQAGNQHQNNSADWAQHRAQNSAEVGFNQASSGMQMQNEQTKQGIDAATQSTYLSGGVGILKGVAGGALAGPVGAAIGGVSSAVDAAHAVGQTMISNNASHQGNMSSQRHQGMTRDSNKQYADFASSGDNKNAIAGINAKIQDAKMTQPSVSGQSGGDAFLFSQYKWGYDLKIKMIQKSAMRSIGEFWLRYGYPVNIFATIPASLKVMEKFTYWKLRETYIVSSTVPEDFKNTIRGIMESGVTVWSNPNDMGVIDLADNEPLTGITL